MLPLLAVVPNVAGLSTGRAVVMTGHFAWVVAEMAVVTAGNSQIGVAALRGVGAGAVGWVVGLSIIWLKKYCKR
jgi:hypothetical protein